MTKNITLWLLAILLAIPSTAQSLDYWQDVEETQIEAQGDRPIIPQRYRTLALDIESLIIALKNSPQEFDNQEDELIFSFPLPTGEMKEFVVEASSIMEAGLAAKFPEIQTYIARSKDANSLGRIDITPAGFHAMIYTPQGTFYIDPYSMGQNEYYISYYRKDYLLDPEEKVFQCLVNEEELPHADKTDKTNNEKSGDEDAALRIYRMAVATTSEYTAYHGGTVNAGIAAIVTTINRVNTVYEREISVRFILVNDNDLLVYTNAVTDPFTNGEPSDLIGENQEVITEVIGAENYDIGHNFGTSGGGLASLFGPCNDDNKARGVSGIPNPIGDPFDVEYVCHEVGHQFTARHTFNGSSGSCASNITGSSAYEPGSGTTIMAYSGICGGQNIVGAAEHYFHINSLLQMIDYSTQGNGNDCAVLAETNNNAPEIISYTTDYAIPQSTPFVLSAQAFDIDGDSINYCWEQFDLGPQGHPYAPVGDAPIFRTYIPTTDTFRVFPRWFNIVNNSITMGEILPTYERTLNFKLTVRDNQLGGGCISIADSEIDVLESSGPFLVSYPNESVSWSPGSTKQVTWEVANTHLMPIDCQSVNILLSTDGGYTYPITLAQNVPNNGSYEIIVPDIPGSSNRIMVAAADNIFFDISDSNFTIYSADAPAEYSLDIFPSSVAVCGETVAEFSIITDASPTFVESINLSVSALPMGAEALFSNGENTIELTQLGNETFSLNNLTDLVPGRYFLNLDAEVNGNIESTGIELIIENENSNQAGASLVLDGEGDYVDLPAFDLYSNEVTISAWIKPDGLQNDRAAVIFSRDANTIAGITLTEENGLGYAWNNNGTTWSSGLIVPENEWSHVALVIRPYSATVYLNGIAATNPGTNSIEQFNGETRIGHDSSNSARYFNGEIEEVKIWKRSLSIQELRESMHLTANDCPNDLFAYYQFNTSAGTNVVDVVRSFDGTLEGNATYTSSTAPVGGGAAVSNNEATALLDFGEANLEIDLLESGDGKIVASRLDVAPNGIDGVGMNDFILGGQYWIINRFEDDSDVNSDLTFIPFDQLTAEDGETPIQLLLYGRAFNSDQEWTLINNAFDVNLAENSVTVKNIENFEQFLIARTEDAIISVSTLDDFCNVSVGETSNEVSYQVGAVNVSSDVLIVPPEGFEISLSSGSGFVSFPQALALSPIDGKIPQTTIYVRFTPTADQPYIGEILHSSTGTDLKVLEVEAHPTSVFSGNAALLDGDNDFIRVNEGLDLNSNTVTITAWIKPDGMQSNFAGLVFSRALSTTAGISLTDQNELRYHWNNGGWWYESGLFVPVDKWSYVALVITPDSASLYLNGERSTDIVEQEPEEFDGRIRIGNDPAGGDRFFGGEIDEVRIWNKAIEAEEVREKMHLTVNKCSESELELYLQFNEFEGDTYDLANNILSEFRGGATRVWATQPVGPGSADTQNETAGFNDFPSLDMDVFSPTSNDVQIVATKLDITPWGTQGTQAGDEVFNNQYWIINRFAPESFNYQLSFKVSEDLTDAEANKPSRVLLYNRENVSDGVWTFVDDASSVDAANDIVTFSNINEAGQYLIVRTDNPVGIESILDTESINIYPNPATNVLHLDFNLPEPIPINYTIYNIIGEEVQSGDLALVQTQKHLLELNNLSNGIYSIVFRASDKTFVQKIVVTK